MGLTGWDISYNKFVLLNDMLKEYIMKKYIMTWKKVSKILKVLIHPGNV